MRKNIFFCIWFLCSIIVAGCANKTINKNKVTMQLNWTNDPTFTGEYIAKEKFWMKEKLDVEIRQGGIGIDPIGMIVTKKSNFAVVGADKALIAISNSAPIKIVSVDLQRNPVGWIARTDLKIVSFEDLKNRNDVVVGDKAGTETSAILKLILKRKKISVTPKAVGFDFSYFIANKNVIYPVYLNEEPMKARIIYKIPIVEIDPSLIQNGKIRLYGNVIITHNDTFINNKNIVNRFINGLTNGWKYALNNQEDTLNIVNKYVDLDKQYLRETIKRTLEFASNMYGKQVPPGHMEIKAWEETLDTLIEAGLIKNKFDLNNVICFIE